ncbi:MAG: nitroreductase family protein [Clostridiales bacterium]|jgi:nitroreductase|nr:nitroreductase family protein [Clostridiales bacterium]
MPSVLDVARARRSIRKYLPKPVEDEKLQQVLEAGRIAPTASNAQKWRFVAVRDPETIKKLVNACGGQAFVGEAPVFLAACADGPDRVMNCGQKARVIDCSIAMSFMILTAAELGLGTCWLGNFSNDKVKRLLGIPDDSDVIAVTPLGYPGESPDPRPRRPMGEVVSYEAW